MPIYEYEPYDRECLICEGKLQLMQSISEDTLSLCPFCGMEIKKLVSRATFKLQKHSGQERFLDLQEVREGSMGESRWRWSGLPRGLERRRCRSGS
jgi:putative FmdB family regulatory protein